MKPEQIDQIERIVKDILQSRIPEFQPTPKSLLVILGATQKPLDTIFQQLTKCRQDGWRIQVILSELATKVIDINSLEIQLGEDKIIREEDLTDIPSVVESSSVVLLPAISYPMVGKLALRLVDTPSTYLVYHALCQGKQVVASTNDLITRKHYFEKEIQTLDKIDEEHVNTLSGFGVIWVTEDMISETIRDADMSYKVFTQSPIISASLIDNLALNVRELVYRYPTIVTPLARDYAKKRGIDLVSKQ
ncbi:hypothetical protein JT359_05695 [Candidatus Poribacteria bacterium]|nr:hypothetical protein [Candidatus Poribacteria bacterium]